LRNHEEKMSNAHDVEAMAKADTAPYVTFSLADEIYAIDVLQVQEVLKVTEIAPVPGVPQYILGIINLRGNVVTVIDARRRMGLEEREPDAASRIVIIDVDHQNVGILVDSVSEVVRISPDAIETAPEVGNDDSNRFIQGVTSTEDGLTILVDLNRLLSDEEWAQLREL
jgi:purine-binding chemotaxis protein CheW